MTRYKLECSKDGVKNDKISKIKEICVSHKCNQLIFRKKKEVEEFSQPGFSLVPGPESEQEKNSEFVDIKNFYLTLIHAKCSIVSSGNVPGPRSFP